ncbi:four-carbon acid sugar kinase family protein [Paenibacillus sp. JSM ZJ436]|uniref:four-carbon acid sugar kinase family protein n=1 Tax=Paenibacillus sp. JSM ZJ436 TaxID=3376190 RepID=UPI0037BD24D3
MKLKMAYYADDFTGGTDSMQMLANAGYKTMLFLELPSAEWLKTNHPELECIGVAGVSRSMDADQMDRELRPCLHELVSLNADILHYKICSTCDSSETIGNVGKVMEWLRPLYPDQPFIPFLAASPELGRYTVFGHHFAAWNDIIYRLDRHPVMAKHPVTPMGESDLRLHFAQQTRLRCGQLNILDNERHDDLTEVCTHLAKDVDFVILDAVNQEHMTRIGRLLRKMSARAPLCTVGSSGIQTAWALGSPSHQVHNSAVTIPPRPTLVLSGSCSPTTRQQMDAAEQHGFRMVRLEVHQWLEHPTIEEQQTNDLISLLQEGHSAVAYTASGPDDESIPQLRDKLAQHGLKAADSGEFIGRRLGSIAKRAVKEAGIRRLVLAGGDSSGFASRELGVTGLQMLWSVSPGAPLCHCYSEDPEIDGMELALKGGQLGHVHYFESIRSGT